MSVSIKIVLKHVFNLSSAWSCLADLCLNRVCSGYGTCSLLNESKEAVPCNNYFIEEYFESQDLITIGKAEYFRMTIDKRGGVRAVKIMEK